MIKKEEPKFIVYIHINKQTGNVFYVGIGVAGREKQKYKRSVRWFNYVKKYGFDWEIVFKNMNWIDACETERSLISNIGRKDLSEGGLINMTNGGDGSGGYKGYWCGKKRAPVSEETRKRLREGSARHWLGKKHSDETKKKLSDLKKGKPPWNKGTKGIMKPWNKGVKTNKPGYWLGKNRGSPTPNTILKMNISQKKRWKECPLSEESIKIGVQTRRASGGYFRSEEMRKKISAGVKNYYLNKRTVNG